jgi:hypothetical protein
MVNDMLAEFAADYGGAGRSLHSLAAQWQPVVGRRKPVFCGSGGGAMITGSGQG